MAKTDSVKTLLVVALQDLNDAERAVVERIGSFADGVSPELAAYVREERGRAGRQSARLEPWLEALGARATDASNIWLRATLDDAARDYATIVPGPLRDIALVGAFRKAKQAERVSYETALELAKVVGAADMAGGLASIGDEEASADDTLALLLLALVGALRSGS